MTEYCLSEPSPQTRQDARELLARLYREIGVAAVAAALQPALPEADQQASPNHATPTAARCEDLAA